MKTKTLTAPDYPSPAKRRRAALRKQAEAEHTGKTPPPALPPGVHRGSGTGRAFRNAEKHRIVTEALTDPERCLWSNQRIAKTLELSVGLVNQVRRRLVEAGDPNAKAGQRIGTRLLGSHRPSYINDDTDDSGRIDYTKIGSLAHGLKRPMYTLVALTEQNDPFYARPWQPSP